MQGIITAGKQLYNGADLFAGGVLASLPTANTDTLYVPCIGARAISATFIGTSATGTFGVTPLVNMKVQKDKPDLVLAIGTGVIISIVGNAQPTDQANGKALFISVYGQANIAQFVFPFVAISFRLIAVTAAITNVTGEVIVYY